MESLTNLVGLIFLYGDIIKIVIRYKKRIVKLYKGCYNLLYN